MTRSPGPNDSTPLAVARARLAFTAFAFVIGYFAVALRLADLTLLQAPAPPPAAQPSAKALRADIVDRNGLVIATSLRMLSLFADPAKVTDPKALARSLARILPGEDAGVLEKKISSEKSFVWIRRDITPQQAYDVNALGDPALDFEEEGRRIYPDGNLAAHAVGYTDVDGAGLAGAERQFNARLAGGGAPVRLALDLRVQHIVRAEVEAGLKQFGAKGAVGIVMDAVTGEILAFVSLPDFDPNQPGKAAPDARFNRASLGVFEMGSTFKLFSTAAALSSGAVRMSSVLDAATPIRIGRFTISDYHAKNRPMTLPEVFMYSSNIGTARMAQHAGTERMQEFYKSLGFFAPVPGDFPEKGAPLHPRPWREVDTLTTSFGHGIAVTPLHVARAAAALVNGGVLVEPRLSLEARKPDAPGGERVVSPQVSALLRELLILTVAAGTGGQAAVEGYDVGGKTGTAEKNTGGHYVHNRVLSSFLAAFPMRDPRYVVLVMMDEPQPRPETHGFVTGGWTAAPAVRRIVERMGPLLGLPPGEDSGPAVVAGLSPYLKDKKEVKAVAPEEPDR